MAASVLVVEDDDLIRESLCRAVRAHGYDAVGVASMATARAATAATEFSVVLLDLGLPDGDGVDLCSELVAADPSLPVIVLTARSEEIDVVVALRSGAIDYVVKPFRLAELLARIDRRLAFRARLDPGPVPAEAVDPDLRYGRLTVRRSTREVFVAGEPVALRPREYALLDRLIRDAGRIVSREQLIQDVWDENWWGPTKTLDVHVNAIRRKLGVPRGASGPIVTARGVGYRFDVNGC